MSELEPLLTENEAAKVLNLKPGTLRNWRCRNRGPDYVHAGEAVRYAPSALRDYVQIRTRRAVRVPAA
jgi:hypothetical protein